jgi:MGT family glycosyltransferase
MAKPTALVFAMTPVGHFHRLRPLIGDLAACGFEVVVATDRRFQADVERRGATFHDLFADVAIDEFDLASSPPPLRFVTFAGTFASEVVAAVEPFEPDVVVYDTFAMVGRVVATTLGIPHVNVCAGHDRVPDHVVRAYEVDPRVSVSEACESAVARLRDDFGLEDASHLSWVTAVSPHLNVYCEPPSFISAEAREAFAPVVFYGSLPPAQDAVPGVTPWPHGLDPGRRRVYVCLGSVGWRLFHDDSRAVIETVIEALADRVDVDVLVSVGTDRVDESALADLQRENVAVRPWLDQWSALAEADVFVSHMGLNSTHEAIYHRVPMITYPLFADQPFLARRAIERGLAVPLVDTLRAPVAVSDVLHALAEVSRRGSELEAALAGARALELDVIERRGEVIAQIAELAGVAVAR